MLDHRRAQQKVLHVGRLRREDLAEQVARDLAQVATHDHRRLVAGPAAKRRGGQVETGRPALGGAQQSVEMIHRKRDTEQLEELLGLGAVEGQLGPAERRHRPGGAQASQRQGGIDARRHGDLAARRQTVEHGLDDPPAVRVGNILGVVEHEQERRRRRDGRRQSGHDPLPHRRSGYSKQLSKRRVERRRAVEHGNEIDEQQDGVVVGDVEPQPGDGPALAGGPLQQRRRLAPAGGRRKEHERRVGPSQGIQQHAARHQREMSPRRTELRRQG